MEVKNLKKVAKRIKKAVKKKEKIILFADGDLDGTTSLIVVEEAIQNLSGEIFLKYFPDREKEGYSLNEKALEHLKEHAPGLLIILDAGIANFEELRKTKEFGFENIVIDHHEVLGKVPSDGLIVDPKQKGDDYPFKKFATCTLAFLLAKEMLPKMSEELEKSFMELAGLAVIADMMPEEDLNELVVKSTVQTIFSSFRVGFRALLKEIKKEEDSPRKFLSNLVGILNITEIENHLTQAYLLLSSKDLTGARELTRKLVLEAEQRRKEIRERADEISSTVKEEDAIVFEGMESLSQVLTGAIASRVCNKVKKPCFIFKLDSGKSRGSVRMPKGMDAVQALGSCSHLLLMYGGHPPAAGFSLKNENIDELKKCLEEYFKNYES